MALSLKPNATGVAVGLTLGLALGFAAFHGHTTDAPAHGAVATSGRTKLTFDGVPPELATQAVAELEAQDLVTEEGGETYFDPEKAERQLDRKRAEDLRDEVSVRATREGGGVETETEGQD